METSNVALLAFHNPNDFYSFDWRFEDQGHNVVKVETLDAMLHEMGNREFRWYIMDVNLGSPNTAVFTPAETVYEIIRERVARGDAEFYPLSNSFRVVQAAREIGLPAMDKSDCQDYLRENL